MLLNTSYLLGQVSTEYRMRSVTDKQTVFILINDQTKSAQSHKKIYLWDLSKNAWNSVIIWGWSRIAD